MSAGNALSSFVTRSLGPAWGLAVVVVALVADGGCAPSHELLAEKTRNLPADRALKVVAIECHAHDKAPTCRRIHREICDAYIAHRLNETQGALLQRRFRDVPRLLTAVPEPCTQPRSFGILNAFASAVETCGDRDGGCEPVLLDQLDPSVTALPEVKAYIGSRRAATCRHYLARTSALLGPIGSSMRGPRDLLSMYTSRMVSIAESLHPVSRWCSSTESDELKTQISQFVAQARDLRGTTFDVMRACWSSIGSLDDPIMHNVCYQLQTALARRVDVAILHAVKVRKFGAALSYMQAATQMKIPFNSTRRHEIEAGFRAMSRWNVDVSVASPPSTSGFAQIVKTAMDGLQLQSGMVLRATHVTGSHLIRVKIRLKGMPQLSSSSSDQEGRSRYVAGSTTQSNPRFFSLQRSCRERTDVANECTRRNQRALLDFESCDSRKAIDEAQYKSCLDTRHVETLHGVYGRSCWRRGPYYCSDPGDQCASDRRDAETVCQEFAGTEPTVQKEILREHRYVIRTHVLQTRVQADVLVSGPHVAVRPLLLASQEYRDEEVAPEPEFNVQADPLQLPDVRSVHSELARQLVDQIAKAIAKARDTACESARSTLSERTGTIEALDMLFPAQDGGCQQSPTLQKKWSALVEEWLRRL